ncbi:MAG: HK97 family phage prohead protease [Gammaproteobacteria bacterium]|nr:HK97 family phage prohead protease [Gammaproteobacteria bacterium]
MKKFTQELATKMADAVAGNAEFKEFADNADTKALAETNGTFKFVISDETKDRAGEIVRVAGWDLTNFNKNGVVLFAHDYNSMPVGKATKTYVEGTKLISEGIWAETEKAQTLRKLHEDGFIKTVSVGFIPKEFDEDDGSIITKAELLEYSVVPVPANPNALTLAQEKGIDTVALMELSQKGLFEFNTKETTQETDEDDEVVEDAPVVTGDAPTEPELKEIEATEDDDKDEPKEKGAVLDNFNKETKHKKFRDIDDAFFAFIQAYLWDSSVNVDEFEEMATEFGEIILAIAKGKEPKTKKLDLASAEGKGMGIDAYSAGSDTKEVLNILKDVFGETKDADEEEDDDVLEHKAIKAVQSVAKDINSLLFNAKKVRDSKE